MTASPKLSSVDQKTCDIYEEARKNVANWYTYFSNNIQRAVSDIEFVLGDQWDAQDRAERRRANKPVMQFNRLRTQVTQIIGEQRQNTPAIVVLPVEASADQEDIDLRADMIRHIQYSSRSDIAEQTCFKWQLMGGFGAMRVGTEYESSKSFKQKITINSVEDPTKAFFDPAAQFHDKSDGKFCGEYVQMRKKDFEEEYPEIAKGGYQSFPVQPPAYFSMTENFMNYGADSYVTYVHYYVKEYFKVRIWMLSDGREMVMKDAQIAIKENDLLRLQDFTIEPLVKVDSRLSHDYKIMHYKMIANEILEYSEWPSKCLPIIFADGDSITVSNEQVTRSFIHDARDSQTYVNYTGSESADAILKARSEQWIGTPENVDSEQLKNIWRNPDRVQGLLIAKRDSAGELPKNFTPAPISPSLIQQYQRGTIDIQQILGRHEANLGAPSNETSGVAISNRAKLGNASTFVYFDNLNRAIESVARCVLSLMPKIYSDTRHISLMKQDKKARPLTINEVVPSYPQNYIRNSLENDGFTVHVEAGPNYATQKAESVQALLALSASNPQVFPLIADLVAANINIENMPQLVERLKNIVPPQVIAKEEGKPYTPPPAPPNPMMMEIQMKQQELQMKQRQAALDYQAKAQEMQQKKVDSMLDYRTKEQELTQNEQQMALDHEEALMKYEAQNRKSHAEVAKAELEVQKAATEARNSLLKSVRM